MNKTKNNHFFKRLMAFILVLITLSSALSVTAFAGDSTFMETLINTDKYTYVANLTSDTKSKQRKYAYKYMNMAYVLGKGCGFGDDGAADGTLNSTGSQRDPNYCFRLNQDYKYSDTGYRKKLTGEDQLNEDKALDIFLLIEGYAKADDNSFISDDNKISQAASGKNKYINDDKVKKTTSPLSYPGYYNDTVTTEQSEYAQDTLITLVASLNGILAEVNDGTKFKSVSELVNKSILIRPDSDKNVVNIKPHADGYRGYVIVYSDLTNVKSGLEYETSAGQANRILTAYRINGGEHAIPTDSSTFLNGLNLPRANSNKQLYAYIFPVNDQGTSSTTDDTIIVNDASMFVYAIPKGFTKIEGVRSGGSTFVFQEPIFTENGGQQYKYVSEQGDVPWISIHMLSMYANTVYKQHDISVTTYVEPDTNIFSKMIAGIFTGILWVIRSVLGLSNIDVLVFNLGQRGSAAYNFGLMSENWWNVVLQYQLIFQAIAWVVLVCGFIKTLIELNLSTINPQKRMSVYETIQKFIVVGIGLVILIPAVQFLLECNNVLVELFASQIETSSLNMPAVNNVLVQFLVGMMWITILLYINFIYIMRSITVALLIASGPFFISTIAFSRGGKSSLFTSWAKELLANIFVQSVHAFVLSFLVQLLVSGTFLETFAIAISIIPITEMFRNLIFAGAGGSTSQMANTAAGAMNKMGTSAIKGAMAGGAAIAGAFGAGGEGGGSGEGGGGSGGSGGSKGNPLGNLIGKAAQNKANKMANGTSAGAKIRQKSEEKTGKAGGSFGAKLGGFAVDGAGMAGLAIAGMMTEMPDMVQGMSDLALKGDASALGNAIEHSTSRAVSNTGSTVAAGVKGAADAKNKQSASKAANATAPQQMGQQAVTETAAAKGENASGAQIQTPEMTGEKAVYSRSHSSHNTQDISKAGEQAQAQAYAAFKNGGNQQVRDVMAFNADGTATKGKEYSYTWTDDKGDTHNGSFMIAGEGASKAVQEQAAQINADAKKGEGPGAKHAHQIAGAQQRAVARKETVKAAANEGEQAGAAMASIKGGENVTDKYFDENGKVIEDGSIIKGEDGQMRFVNNETAAQAGQIMSQYAEQQRDTKNGAVYSQNTESYAKSMSDAYKGNVGSDGVVDMKSLQMGENGDAVYTDAAMIASVGQAVEGQEGVYTLGNQTYDTGLTKSQATDILNSRGINGVKGGSTVSYHQHTPQAKNASLVGTSRSAAGHPIAQYASGIGQAGGPNSWSADGRGGGTMSFSSQHAAATYFQAQGNTTMANQIAGVANGSEVTRGAQTFTHNSDGSFNVSFDGDQLKQQGMKMEVSANGHDMYVSSFDSQVKDPFALDTSAAHENENPVTSESSEIMRTKSAQEKEEEKANADAQAQAEEEAKKQAEAAKRSEAAKKGAQTRAANREALEVLKEIRDKIPTSNNEQ